MANHVLEILDGDRAGDVLSLSDRALRIGRKPNNDLVLADEKTSGVHAEVVFEGGRHVLRDLGSTNGTFLDGKRVTEIVLSAGDVVTIGRLRVKFRTETEAAAAGGDAGDLAVHRLDANRVQKRGGSIAVLGALLVLGLAAGGYLWWQGRAADRDPTAVGPRRAAPLVVAGNKLSAALASCEGETTWNLRFLGAGFQLTSRANTGAGALQAARSEESGAGDPVSGGTGGADFAIATLQEPLTVLSGRTLTIGAHVQTEGDARIGVRAVFFAANDSNPFRFRSGTPLQQASAWTEASAVLAVPPGCDRLQIELVAVLPSAGATALIDDISVVESGAAEAVNLTLVESKQTAIGTSASIAIRSNDPDNPATLLAIQPDRVLSDRARAGSEGLHRAGYLALSDFGATLGCTATERSFQLKAQFAGEGESGLQFVFPAEAAGSLLVQSNETSGFESAAADSTFTARAVLIGNRLTRAMLQFATPVACSGKVSGGIYRLGIAATEAELVLGFRQERQQAGESLQKAQADLAKGQPGAALDKLQELASKVPHDSENLAQVLALRAQIHATQGEAQKRLQKELAEATFFNTRGGFARVAIAVEDLLTLYGERNIEDLAAIKVLRSSAQERLVAMDAAEQDSQRARLLALQKALEAAQQTGLASVVQNYVQRHLGR